MTWLQALKEGNGEAATTLVNQIRTTYKDSLSDAFVQRVLAEFDLVMMSKGVGDLEPLKRRLELNESDHEARHDLALGLFALGMREEGVTHLLYIVQKQRDWEAGKAMTSLFKLIDSLDPADPLTSNADVGQGRADGVQKRPAGD